MLIEPQRWLPRSFPEAAGDVASRVIRETHFLELKRHFEASPAGTAKLYKALASLANHGGVLVIGVGEDKPEVRADALYPVPLATQVERVMQVAASLDPPLALPTPLELADPDDPTRGVVVVMVPASPMAPHRTARHGYFSRDARQSFVMPDAEVARLISLRDRRSRRADRALEDHMAYARPLLAPENRQEAQLTWFGLALEPDPSGHFPYLLRSRLNADVRSWLEPHMNAATAMARTWVLASDELAGITNSWEPLFRGPRPVRISGGVRFQTAVAVARTPALTGILEVVESGGIRISQNYLNYEGEQMVRWQDLLGATAWTLALYQSIQAEAGSMLGAALSVHVDGLAAKTPCPHFNNTDHRRRDPSWVPDPYPATHHQAHHAIGTADIERGLPGLLDGLFGQLLRDFSLPDLLAPPR